MKTSDLWNKFIAGTMNEKQMNFSYADFEKAINERIKTEHQWLSFKDHRPPYYKTCLVKVHEKTEPIAAWLASTGDSDIWTICSTDIILPPVKLWRPIF